MRTLSAPSTRAAATRGARMIARAPDSAQTTNRGFEKGLSGDVLTMFHEAQRNILELNKSRLMALDELRQAKARIRELEEQVQSGGSRSSSRGGTSTSAPLTIAYSTGWDNAYIHYQRSDGSWTSTPGERMQKGVGRQPGLFVARLDQETAEFVFNNGEGDWDSPMPMHNYKVGSPGEYLVQAGKVSKLS